MQDVNVLVVFPTRGEWMERLALAAAVGAVQGRANIRLRCLEAAADRDHRALFSRYRSLTERDP